jgi:hypothetical protein
MVMIKIELSNKIRKDIRTSHLEYFLTKQDVKTLLENFEQDFFKSLSSSQRSFLTYLIKNIDDVLIGSPKRLREIIAESERLNIKFIRKRLFSNKLVRTRFNTRLAAVFDYEKMFSKGPSSKVLRDSKLWTSYHFTDLANCNVCPYCNRIYTNTEYTSEEGRCRPDLDHYYPQSRYPFLALSIYNLIPCCSICNSRFKLNKDFYREEHLHPFENEMGKNIRFSLEPIKANMKSGGRKRNGYDLEFTKGKLEQFKIKIDYSMEKSAKLRRACVRSDHTFHLTHLYQSHKDEISELIQMSKVYKPEYTDWLEKKYVGKIFESRDEIKQMVIGSYLNKKDFGKRPLSKLKYDISKELKL